MLMPSARGHLISLYSTQYMNKYFKSFILLAYNGTNGAQYVHLSGMGKMGASLQLKYWKDTYLGFCVKGHFLSTMYFVWKDILHITGSRNVKCYSTSIGIAVELN